MRQALLLLFSTFLFANCSSPKEPINDRQKVINDSLEVRCNDIAGRKQFDSLRIEAEYFIKQTQPGSEAYFSARRFYIESWFRKGDYSRALDLLKETEQMPEYKDQPISRASYTNLRILCYQRMGRFDEALVLARTLMDITPIPGDTATYEKLRLHTLDAMIAANSIFFMKGAIAEGADWFRHLRMNPPKIAAETCLHDMMVFEGYLRAMSGAYAQGAAIMDSARLIPNYRPNAETNYRNSSFAAAVYYNLPERQKDVEALIKQTITQGHKDHFMRGVTWGVTALGQLYQSQARYKEAIQLQYQGLGIGLQRKDSALCAQCYSCLSELYGKWKLYPQTKYYADKAILWAHNNATGNYDKGTYYAQKYRAERLMGRIDPQLFAKADSCFALANVDLARAKLISLKVEDWFSHRPDSIDRGLKLLDGLPQLAGQGWYQLCYGVEALRTIGLLRIGREADARRTLLSIETYRPGNDYAFLDTLMKHYIQRNDVEAIAHITKLREPLSATYHEEQVVSAVMAADIRYQTEQKEQQNQILTTELSLKDARLQTYITTGVAMLLIAFIIVSWLWMRQHSFKLRLLLSRQEKVLAEANLREQSERLQQLIVSRQELNNHNEELLRQLAEVQAISEKSCNLDKIMERLQPRLLTKDEESQFRSSFAILYPTVLHQLRTVCPRATRTDELICMLIILKQTNEEIANVLGISRPSVLQNRYRLRNKLNLPEGSDLDEGVRQLLLS